MFNLTEDDFYKRLEKQMLMSWACLNILMRRSMRKNYLGTLLIDIHIPWQAQQETCDSIMWFRILI